MNIYIFKNEQQYGPYTVEQLREYVQQGHFTLEDHACGDGQNWIPLAQIPGFAAQAQAGQPQQAQVPQAGAQVPQAQVGGSVGASKWKATILFSVIGVASVALIATLLYVFIGDDDEPENQLVSSESIEEKDSETIQEDDDGLRRALEGRDLVVYLARTGELGPMNRMTDQVFQAVMDVCPSAMVIGSSSVHATGGAYFPFDKEPFSRIAARAFDGVDPWPRLSARLEPCPTGDYGLTKAYVEAWCQRLGAIGQSAVAARWGGINARNAMTEEVAYFTVWCHQEDAAQFVDGCFKAHRNGTLRSGAHYYVISDNTYSIFDIETAREEVGYTPVHDAEALVTR